MTLLRDDQVSAYCARVPSATEREPMSRHTTFHIGGDARIYVVVTSADACVEAVRAAQELAVPFYIYGGGTNVLVADTGYEGVIIQMANREMTVLSDGIRVDAGVVTALAARKSVELGWAGFEWAVTIPGTIGGAVFGNAGCFGGEMKDVVRTVDAYDLIKRERMMLSNAACQFVYRGSGFKQAPHLILSVELVFPSRQSVEEGKATIDKMMQRRKDSQPMGASTCGCVFRNYEYTSDQELEILRREVDEIPEHMASLHRLGAGWLVEQAGAMGQRVGDMEVSTKHGNFFLNHGRARAEDVLALISLVKMNVRDKLGIQLHEEVQYIGFDNP